MKKFLHLISVRKMMNDLFDLVHYLFDLRSYFKV